MNYKSKLYKRIREYCKVNYEKLDISDFVLGDNPFNRRCHLNSVQKIKEGKAKEVCLCIAWDNDFCPCVHFINKLEDGKYQDNTWGWLYEENQYYIVRKVKVSEYDKIGELLMVTKRSLLELTSSKFMRWIHRIKEDSI